MGSAASEAFQTFPLCLCQPVTPSPAMSTGLAPAAARNTMGLPFSPDAAGRTVEPTYVPPAITQTSPGCRRSAAADSVFSGRSAVAGLASSPVGAT